MNPSNIDDFNKLQEFVRDASPAAWLEYAEELRDSAEYVWSRDENQLCIAATLDSDQRALEGRKISIVSRTYMLLAGFALENLLKGRLVSTNPTLVNQGFLSNELKSHDIVALAEKIQGLRLSEEERRFCENAAKAVPYWGRYPVPLKKGQLSPEVGVDETLRQAFLGLFERLAHDLHWTIRDGWDSGVGPKTLKIRSVKYGDRIDPKEPLFDEPK